MNKINIAIKRKNYYRTTATYNVYLDLLT